MPRDAKKLDVVSSSPISPASASADDAFAEDDGLDDCGSFVSSDEGGDIEYLSEPIERYTDGIYYPICIGDVLADTYRIVHKLGWGGFSTVWMAHNIKSQKMVALKIGAVGLVSKLEDRELEMQRKIRNTVKDPSRLVTFLDTFPLNRDIGDINDYTLKMAYREFSRPRKTPLWFAMWKRGQLVEPIQVNKESLRGGIFLTDFSMAIEARTPVKRRWQAPTTYCAPERFHGTDPSFASDMWSYMCLFVQLYMGFAPFRTLTDLVDRLGPLPLQWAGRYDAGDEPKESWYDQTQKPAPLLTLEETSKRGRPEVSDVERKLVVSVLLKGLAYLPEYRPTAAELLEDEDFKALMAIYEL
ncbi:CMGC kinase [Cordyceps militaris]|uniref:CMGC kinase n=1 Tax=Cordyceps militaris TaxID=73501 RepID=A0A2H4S6A1_CORMI|nr:CMGC kinase [Cordyceps militaris]